jgi:hypothetical protein
MLSTIERRKARIMVQKTGIESAVGMWENAKDGQMAGNSVSAGSWDHAIDANGALQTAITTADFIDRVLLT